MENEIIEFHHGVQYYKLLRVIGTYRGIRHNFQVYKVIVIAGQSGTSDESLSNDRYVAIKVVVADNIDAMTELANAAASHFVEHDNLVEIQPFSHGRTYVRIPYMLTLRSVKNKWFPNGMNEMVLLSVLRDTLRGLQALHYNDVVHSELSAGRVFVTCESRPTMIKLSYGASSYDEISGDEIDLTSTTRLWRAPELGLHYVSTKKSDVWVIGAMAIKLASTPTPEFYVSRDNFLEAVYSLRDEGEIIFFGDSREAGFSDECINLVLGCLQEDPDDRPSVDDLLNNQIFAGVATTSDIFEHWGVYIEGEEEEEDEYDGWVMIGGEARFYIERTIGSTPSGFGSVFLASDANEEGAQSQLMIIQSNQYDESFMAEKSKGYAVGDVMNTLRCDYIREGEKWYCLMSTKVLGSLHLLMIEKFRKGVPELELKEILYQVVSAVSDISRNGRYHGMLCAAHVYVAEDGNIKVGFGGTVFNFEDDICRYGGVLLDPTRMYETAAGPEQMQSRDSRSDVWMVGVLALELIYGGIKVGDRDDFCRGINAVYRERKELPKRFGESIRKSKYSAHVLGFIKECMMPNPNERPCADTLDSHPFLADAGHRFNPSRYRW